MQRFGLKLFLLVFFVLSTVGTGGGGGGGGGDGGGDPGGGGSSTTVSELSVLSSSPTLSSNADSADEGLTITAIALDSNRAAVAGQTVTLSVNSGSLLNATSVTDANGQVTAKLTTGGNPQNRTITITARANSGALVETAAIQVVGTTLGLSGPTTLGFGATGTYTVDLADSGGAGINSATVALSSSNANTPNPTSVTTNPNGQATFSVTGNAGGATTITATALGQTATINITVSADNFSFQTPATNAEINLNTPTQMRVRLLNNGNPVVGTTINFSATRGTISGGDVTAAQDMTNASGDAVVNITSTAAGPALLTATGPNGLVANRNIEFVATTPASIDVQASPASIPTNSQSNITAIVRDANNNLVKNKVVTFSLQDVTGGTLSASTGLTDSQGIVRIQYRSSSQTSATNGVVITAAVQGTAFQDTVSLTVGGSALRITLGTGNEITEPNTTQYNLPYALFVTDANGTPVTNAVVNLSVRSIAYQKGTRFLDDTDGDGTPDIWNIDYKVEPTDPQFVFGFGCRNEDADENGVLGAGEDDNGNNTLQPTNDAQVPSGNITLDDNGTAFFDVTYFQDRADWVKVRLRARAAVSGTETTEEVTFVLPVAASDVDDVNVAPPGLESPYGQGDPSMATATCSDPN